MTGVIKIYLFSTLVIDIKQCRNVVIHNITTKMHIELVFVPTISKDCRPLNNVVIPHMTQRIRQIFQHVVYPNKITDFFFTPTQITVIVHISEDEDVTEFLKDVSYHLTDADITRLGITPSEGSKSIGQNMWADDDSKISLDDETIDSIGLSDAHGVDLIPILVSHRII